MLRSTPLPSTPMMLALIGFAVSAFAIPPCRPGGHLSGTETYAAGKLLSIAWGSEPGHVGQHRLDTRGALSYSPRYLSVAPDGSIYVGDEVNQRILAFDAAGAMTACFDAAYGGYHMFVDDAGDLYTVFRRLFAPFTVAVYRNGRVIREIDLGFFKRNPAGDRVWVDCRGGLHLNLITNYQPIINLSQAVEKQLTMENLISGTKWEYSARRQSSEFGAMCEGYPSRYSDRVYVSVDGELVVRNLAGVEQSRFNLKQPILDQIGLETGVSLDISRALQIFGEDKTGNVYLLARLRIKRPGKSAHTIVKFSNVGTLLFVSDAFPTAIHYGSEVQSFPCSLDVDAHGNIYQLCTEGESGVRLMKWTH